METPSLGWVPPIPVPVPTRWGNQLNGNQSQYELHGLQPCPHSLGKPIEWKPRTPASNMLVVADRPHSLGKPIEWKHILRYEDAQLPPPSVPTRWGNQLNGNSSDSADSIASRMKCPHSLGKPIEWKRFRGFLPGFGWVGCPGLSPLAGETN
jgi:hypothetical protein